jgi:hypothetical protein
MATCLQIITYAMRQARIIGPGKEPKASEADEGLVALQSLYDQWRTNAMFGELEDVYLEEDDTAEEGKRYRLAAGVTLTDATSDYVDESNVTRAPRDLALYESVTSAGVQTAKLYDRTQWVDLIGLEVTDEAPLSGRNPYGLAACLATFGGLATVFGADPDPRTYALAKQFMASIMGKAGSTQDQDGPDYF